MSQHEDRCPHCRTKQAGDDVAAAEPERIELPEVPTAIRVHNEGLPPFDCTLHPDGTLTAVMGGEVRRNYMTFADMQERNWAGAHVEFNPSLQSAREAEPEPTAEVVQEALV
ncbi:hypothetical protein [Streptomyces africanus]|uniref:hypothetical protein n=1 Tax=Streptomyces africanus TaxID=231024 RepID=UPI000A393763|nr:hypothetical protein [Streptomyces africanus]